MKIKRFFFHEYIVTNINVQIEREGANFLMSVLTFGLWYVFFQDASIDIYELRRISNLYLRDDVIIGEMDGHPRRCIPIHTCLSRFSRRQFKLDCPTDGRVATKDLFYELREAWNFERHKHPHHQRHAGSSQPFSPASAHTSIDEAGQLLSGDNDSASENLEYQGDGRSTDKAIQNNQEESGPWKRAPKKKRGKGHRTKTADLSGRSCEGVGRERAEGARTEI